MNSPKDKIAIVSVRYGINVGGGAETLARTYAESLLKKFNVDVITTKAYDHVTWKNEIDADEEIINGVNVKRFPVDYERVMDEKFHDLEMYLDRYKDDIQTGEKFLKMQGPYSTKMLNYLSEHKDEYKYVLYCPYLYAPAFFGVQRTNYESNVLIPAAHDEPFLHFEVMKKEFKNISKIIFLSEEEKTLVNTLYPGNYKEIVTGMAINTVEPSTNFKEKYNLKNPYIIYVGRIEEGKGVLELLQFFTRYKDQNKKIKLDLVLCGKSIMPIPKRKDIIHTGYLTEEDKIGGIKASECLILPSQFESFSIVTLEALKSFTPVLVNGHCAVLIGHCLNSNAGLWYSNYFEFEQTLNYLLNNSKEREIMGRNGNKYVTSNYTDEIIDKKLFAFLT